MDLIGSEFDTVQILFKCTIICHITKLSFYLHFAHTFILTQCILNIYEDLPASNIWKTISLIPFMPFHANSCRYSLIRQENGMKLFASSVLLLPQPVSNSNKSSLRFYVHFQQPPQVFSDLDKKSKVLYLYTVSMQISFA